MNLPRLQNYVTNCKYWKNGNRNGERSQFIKKFSLESWHNLPDREKQMHCLLNCGKCESNEPNISSMHASVSLTTENIISKTTELVHEIENLNSLRSVDGPKQIVKILEPIIENTFNKSFQNIVSSHYNLTQKISSEEKQKQKVKASRESSEVISKAISYNQNEIDTFLASGASFNNRDRARLATYFETPQAAKSRTESNVLKIRSGIKKPKNHIGKMTNYTYDKQGFKKYITSLKPGSRISWRNLSIKFDVRNKIGSRPSNAGQVLMEVAKSFGIDVSRFNADQRLSGRDYIQRVRRARHKLMHKKVSIPTPRPTRKLHAEIRRKITSGELYVGKNIAPKSWKRNKISKSGKLEETEITVYGRKIPLQNIRIQMNKDQDQFLKIRSDEDYNNLTEEMICQRFTTLNMEVPSENPLQVLKQLERTRNLKVWHDHSDILNHSYVSFMISALYDPVVFLSNQEYREKYPERPPVDVPSAVERPYLYILGQSKSSDLDKLSYTTTRLEDIESLSFPTIHNGIQIYDKLRVFSGDGPARQFEAGHQRGGNFSCLCGIPVKAHQNLECAFQFYSPSLSERVKIFKQGILWKSFSEKNISPFTNLKKDSLRNELHARGIDTFEKTKAEMQEELSSILHGIQRPPALLCTDAQIPSMSYYEIPPCEPLHDLTNLVQNLITELPVHIENKQTQAEFEKFSSVTVGDKNQLKGSDARLFAVKLAKFASQKFAEKKIAPEILQLCTSLVDIISICYSHYSERTPKKILRLYNQSFSFSYLCRSIIGNPQKMTARKFYGCHFHCMTVHAPQTYRIFCLRSLIPEQEERSFGDLRRISLNTSNRQCGKVIENAILRFNAQQRTDRGDSYRKQETMISQQAKLLPESEDSKFPVKILQSRPYLFQIHCERIADFLQEGQNTWWSLQGENIVFHDGPSHPEQHLTSLQHFRSTSIQDMNIILKSAWQKCIQDFEAEKIQLPLLKIKLFDETPRIVRNHSKLFTYYLMIIFYFWKLFATAMGISTRKNYLFLFLISELMQQIGAIDTIRFGFQNGKGKRNKKLFTGRVCRQHVIRKVY